MRSVSAGSLAATPGLRFHATGPTAPAAETPIKRFLQSCVWETSPLSLLVLAYSLHVDVHWAILSLVLCPLFHPVIHRGLLARGKLLREGRERDEVMFVTKENVSSICKQALRRAGLQGWHH